MADINKTIGFIGAGKCGMSLAYYFRDKGVKVSGFSVRDDFSNKAELSSRCGFDFDFDVLPKDELIRRSDIVFITVNDASIPEVWESIRGIKSGDTIFCHCSGSASSSIFIGADRDFVCSVHPMLAFNSRHTSISAVSDAFFTVEGGKTAVGAVSELLYFCKNNFKIISDTNKAKYHAAACFASNFTVAVCHKAVQLLCECGFEESEALSALSPLIMHNAENITERGARGAITGPAARGDSVTIERHLGVLDEKTADLYRALTDIIYEMVQEGRSM